MTALHTKKRRIEYARLFDRKKLEAQQEKERKIKEAKLKVDSLIKFYEPNNKLN